MIARSSWSFNKSGDVLGFQTLPGRVTGCGSWFASIRGNFSGGGSDGDMLSRPLNGFSGIVVAYRNSCRNDGLALRKILASSSRPFFSSSSGDLLSSLEVER